MNNFRGTGNYIGTVTDEFIAHRDAFANDLMLKKKISREEAIRRTDCEFIEWHQCQIDKRQTLFEGNDKFTHHFWDTTCVIDNNLDYKQNSQKGFKLSYFAYNNIVNEIVDFCPVWEWANRNFHKELYSGMKIGYDILVRVSRQYILENAVQAGVDEKGQPIYRVKI